MLVHEYQAKQLLAPYGLPFPPGAVAYTAREAERVAQRLGVDRFAVKAQILAGGRGEAGGVRLVTTVADVRETAARMLGSRLVTAQTGPAGELVRRVYIEQAHRVSSEFYLAALVDRAAGRVALMASPRGGADVERAARRDPASVVKVTIDPDRGLTTDDAARLVDALRLPASCPETVSTAACAVLDALHRAFVELDAAQIELNPLALTADGALVALDVKLIVDDNALFRQRQIADLRDEEAAGTLERARHGFNYLKLDGNVGLMANGAALAMATMDILALHGVRAANFLDLPPSASREQIGAAFRQVLSDPDVQVVLVNVVGGGLTRCDSVAEGMAAAVKAVGRNVPMVVRFEGTNRDLGKKTLRDTGVDFEPAQTLSDAARAVAAALGAH
ncbi:MAG: ADP-forming succinate--CoA ligase subunit beta [Chromatiales bacterium]|nr:ADP-forming succinate--CoA ligase subunit beta [Chromatiales bacterium]